MREEFYTLTKAQIVAIFREWCADAKEGNWPFTNDMPFEQADEFCRRANKKIDEEAEERA